MRPAVGRRQFVGWGLGAIWASGCGKRTPTSSGEPTGGTWRPILLDPAQLIRLPPPPAPGSSEETAELAELVALTRRRDPRAVEIANHWSAGASVRWNEIARELVARHRTQPPLASRVYAILSVACLDALIAVWNNKYHYRRAQPSAVASDLTPMGPLDGYPSYPSAHAAVAGCSAAVLSALYPARRDWLMARAAEHQESRLVAGRNFRSDMVAGESLGRTVAALALEHARADGADAVWTGSIPTGAGRWTCADGEEPIAGRWGEVRPWLAKDIVPFRAPPPPEFDTPAFRSALAEVKRVAETRTREQARTAALWADGAGSYTPPGRWNKIGCDLALKHQYSELRAARMLALLNTAVMDAGIASFDTKYHYWVLRPSQADPQIPTPVGLPNFPAYTSAHAAFSGAASTVLAGLFPVEAANLRASAEEAALSRIYGGIHYRFDGEAGLAQGRALGRLALVRGARDGSS